MALIFEVGQITSPLSPNQTKTEVVTLTKFSASEPLKALILFGVNSRSSEENGIRQFSGSISAGFTDGTNHGCTSAFVYHNLATTNCYRRHSTSYLIYHLDANGSNVGLGVLSAFSNTGFTIDFSGWLVYDRKFLYIAIGGSDITDAKVLQWNEPQTDEANPKSIAVGFQPDLILSTSDGGFVADTTATQFIQNFGICAGAGTDNQIALANASYHSQAAANTESRSADAGVLARASETAYSETVLTPEANGFSANVTQNAGNTTASHYVTSLCLKGGNYQLIKEASPTSLSTQNHPITFGQAIKGVLAMTRGGGIGRFDTFSRFNLGASDGTEKYSYGYCEVDAADPTQVTLWHNNDRLIEQRANSSVVLFSANDTINADSIDIEWTDVDTFERQYYLLAFGDKPVTSEDNASLFMGCNC